MNDSTPETHLIKLADLPEGAFFSIDEGIFWKDYVSTEWNGITFYPCLKWNKKYQILEAENYCLVDQDVTRLEFVIKVINKLNGISSLCHMPNGAFFSTDRGVFWKSYVEAQSEDGNLIFDCCLKWDEERQILEPGTHLFADEDVNRAKFVIK